MHKTEKETCNCENKHCNCDETCTCGCSCDCGSQGNQNKEIAFELCRTLIEGRTYTAEGVAESFKKIYEAVKSCN